MNDETRPPAPLIVYGHAMCGQAVLLRRALQTHAIAHEWRDVLSGEPRYREELKRLARGNLSVPTVVFADGTVMVEPWSGRVLAKLGIESHSVWARLLKFVRTLGRTERSSP